MCEVVAVGALVEDVRDHAVHLGAELVVGLLVREAARGEQADVLARAVGAGDVVERAVVLGEERAHGAVLRDAGVARGAKDVARALRRGGGGTAGAGGGHRGRHRDHSLNVADLEQLVCERVAPQARR